MSLPPSGDDLDEPLGANIDGARRAESEFPYVRVAALGLAVIAASLVLFAYVTGDQAGGQPFAVSRIEAPLPATPPRSAAEPDTASTGALAAVTPGTASRKSPGDAAEEQDGLKVTRLGSGPTAAKIIHIPPRDAPKEESEEQGAAPLVGSAVEGHGGLQVTPEKQRSLTSSADMPAGASRVALIVGGMGLNRIATAKAMVVLPAQVTLAFSPFGPDLAVQTTQAREQGHELILQAPMQPIDARVVEGGARRLAVAAASAENLERLHWFMGRFSGYIAVMNSLGGGFTADADAFRPVLRDLAARGLIYADDGVSPGSLARPLAAETGVPLVSADLVIDADPKVAAVDAALLRLESLARSKGLAVGSADGLPSTVERIGAWARAARARGVTLVPLSAAVAAPRQVSLSRRP